MTAQEIRKAIEESEYEVFGLRSDSFVYEIGDTANYSHELFQDPMEDLDGNLLFPLIEEGPYAGFYDAGELDGTCAVEVTLDNVEEALNEVKMYEGEYIYLIAGRYGHGGNDIGEIIIPDAEIIAK